MNNLIPIHRVSQRYFIYDLDHMMYLRRDHRILGLLVGTLPQSPQQNVFFGLPNQLLPEEARLLVEKGVCYIVDDTTAQQHGLDRLERDAPRKALWLNSAKETGLQAALERDKFSKQKKKVALERMSDEKRAAAIKSLEHRSQESSPATIISSAKIALNVDEDDAEAIISTHPNEASIAQTDDSSTSVEKSGDIHAVAVSSSSAITPFSVTPTTSCPPLEAQRAHETGEPLPKVPDSYPLYRYLHSEVASSNYFMTPGLRFGCQYSVYPGDPLRFHSHFLALSRGWDEEIDLMALVGGGRLGTGVKKGYLFGGVEKTRDEEDTASNSVRCFSIEWGGM